MNRSLKLAYRSARALGSSIVDGLRSLSTPARLKGATRLHLGAGPHQMAGWANIDLSPPNIIWDLTRPLPIERGTVEFAYTEHFIEHIHRRDGQAMLDSLHKAMKPGGVLRISCPDLAAFCRNYTAGRLVGIPELDWNPKSLCEMVNDGVRGWEHLYLYDFEELSKALKDAGFTRVYRCQYRESEFPELRNLETRPDAEDLIVEAVA